MSDKQPPQKRKANDSPPHDYDDDDEEEDEGVARLPIVLEDDDEPETVEELQRLVRNQAATIRDLATKLEQLKEFEKHFSTMYKYTAGGKNKPKLPLKGSSSSEETDSTHTPSPPQDKKFPGAKRPPWDEDDPAPPLT